MKRDKPKPPPKKPGQSVKPAAAQAKAEDPLGDADARRAQRRVAMLRDKIRTAMDDPGKRQQIVDAIRVMMREE